MRVNQIVSGLAITILAAPPVCLPTWANSWEISKGPVPHRAHRGNSRVSKITILGRICSSRTSSPTRPGRWWSSCRGNLSAPVTV